MDGTAVKEIERLANEADVGTIEIDGVEFTTRPVYRTPLPERRREESVDVIALSSLQGIVDYLGVQQDGLTPEAHFIHVESATRVRVVGSLVGQGETNQRHTFLTAAVSTDRIPFDTQLMREEAQILLQARFAENEDRSRALKLIGTLETEGGVKQEDDGISQRITAKSGIARLEERTVENPFRLAPFRTFPEVDPPESPFVLRLKKVGDDIVVLLLEADGGAWRIEAVRRIREWLEEQDTGFKVIS